MICLPRSPERRSPTRAPPGTPPSRPLKCGRLGDTRVDRRAPAEGLDEFCHAPPRRATLAAVRSDEARVCARRRSTAWPLPARGSRDTSAGPAGMPAHATSAAYSAAGYAPACLFVSASPNPAASVCHGSTRDSPMIVACCSRFRGAGRKNPQVYIGGCMDRPAMRCFSLTTLATRNVGESRHEVCDGRHVVGNAYA